MNGRIDLAWLTVVLLLLGAALLLMCESMNTVRAEAEAEKVVVDPVDLTLSEPWDTDRFTLTLTSQPDATVFITLTASSAERMVLPTVVGLGAGNRAAGMTATVTVVDDAIVDRSQLCWIETSKSRSGDPAFDGLKVRDVKVTVLDDDVAGVVVNPQFLTVSEPLGSANFSITLTSQPMDVVLVSLVSTAAEQCEVSPATVDLNATNWAQGVTTTVAVVDDAIADGSQRCVIQTGPAVRENPLYNDPDPEDVMVIVLDNETVTRVYMPLVLQCWPPIPEPPTLAAIENVDGDGAYSISWSSVSGAVLYILEESSNAMFSDAREISVDSRTSYAVTQRGAGRCYYRVKAHSQWGDSCWSAGESVDVLWEAEPNDQAQTEANGPVVSGLMYHGAFPSETDRQDYYYFDLLVPHSVELWLTNIPVEHNYDLILRDAALNVVGYSGRVGNASEHILTGLLPAGRYYSQVYHRSSGGSSQPYHLSTTYE